MPCRVGVPESGAEATALQTLTRLSGIFVFEPREAFGLRRVYRRFQSARGLAHSRPLRDFAPWRLGVKSVCLPAEVF